MAFLYVHLISEMMNSCSLIISCLACIDFELRLCQ